MFNQSTLIDRRPDKLDPIESVLAPQLDEATAQFDARRAGQRRKALAEHRKAIAAAEKNLEATGATLQAAQAEFDRINAEWRVADERLRSAMAAAHGASSRLDREQGAQRQALGPLGNAVLDEVLVALQSMRDNARTLIRQSPRLRKSWITGETAVVGLDIENPNMAELAARCASAIDELEAMRYSERTPAEIEAAARAALRRCREIGGDTYRNLVGVPFEALPA